MRAVASVLTFLALALLAGCDDRKTDFEPAPEPRHPAMTHAPDVRPGSPHEGHSSGLPPGHPPMGGGPAAGSASGAVPDTPLVRAGPVELVGREGWLRRAPSSNFVIAEFVLPRVEGDPDDGRITVSSAGGSVEANVMRWQNQFQGSPPVSTEKKDIAGLPVVVVRIEGTFLSRSGPEAPNTKMWAAIISVPGGNQNVFLKATGPKRTMDHWDASLGEFLESMSQ